VKKRICGIGLVILLILGLLVVVGCGKDDTTATTASGGTATTAAQTPVVGGTLRWVSGSQPAGIQIGVPWKYNASVPPYLLPVVEPLIIADETGNLQPWLAKSWEVAADNLSITFKLRDDVKFHDGTPFNAEAVRWNIDQQIAAKGPTTANMTSVEVVDEFTVKLNLKAWDALLLNQITNSIQCLLFISPTAYQANGETGAESKLVGTGPFMLQSWDNTVGAKMVKNPNYWQKGKPYLDEIDFTFLSDPTAAIMAVKGGQADVGYFFRGSLVDQKKALEDAGYPMYYYKNGMGIYAMFPDSGNASSPLANATLRQAIEYATDKETLCKSVGYGLWTPVYQACSPANAAYNASLEPQRKFDLTKAKELLTQAGYNGQVIKLYTLQSDSALSQAIQSMWKTAGITSEIVLMDQPSWVANMNKGWTDGYLISAIGTNPVWVSNLPRYLATPPISYVSMARSDALNTALTQAKAAKDLAGVIAKTQEIVKVVNDEAVLLPLFMHEADYNVSTKVHNFGYDISGQWNAAEIWIEK
jgi:peptide/nickel transport system substrate-binding protein